MQVLIIGRREDYQQPIEHSLAELGVDWEIRFAADATAALIAVRESAPEVVVTELQPLGMDGGALLERIRSHAPQAARIMLLEEDEAAQALRALGHAHRLLNKPLRAEELIEAVDGIGELRDLLNSPELKAAIGKIDRLPPPPKLYLQLSRAVNDPDTSLAQLAALVAQDPSTAAKVLRVCNSAYFSAGREIADVRSAVIRLGQQELRRIVLAAEVFRDLPGGVDREAMRQRSLLASQIAGKIIDNANAEMATTAALLAEVGQLLPGVRVPDAHGQLQGDGPHYAEAGAYLLGMWGLPMPIVEAVAHHCHPQRTRGRGFWIGGAVHVACALAAGRAPDEAYLQAVGVAPRLPAWRQLAAELGAKQAADNAPPAAEPKPAGAEARRQAAAELLAIQPGGPIEAHGVRYLLLAQRCGGRLQDEVIDAAFALHKFDAVAVGLSASLLESERLPEPAAGLIDVLSGHRRLGERALAHCRARLAHQLGSPANALLLAAVEAGHRAKLPVWLLDLELDSLLRKVFSQLGLAQRLALWGSCRRPPQQAPASIAVEALDEGDLPALTFSAASMQQPALRRLLFAERAQHMLARLRDEQRRSRAQRVLLVLPYGHLAPLRRGLRESRDKDTQAAAAH